MKKLFTFLSAVLLTVSVLAQSPEKLSYQAVIRNISDVLVTNTQVGMQISILQGTSDGSPVYVETQTPTTNANGLLRIEIGDGTVLNGDFSTIDWTNGPYYVKTETDPAGSTDYTITGVSQLLSVPYALHAKTAQTVIGGITESDPVFTAWDKDYADLINTPAAADGAETIVTAGTNVTITGSGTTANPYEISASSGGATRYVGELFGGGIVFYVDETGEHGLIGSMDNLSSNGEIWLRWSNVDNIGIGFGLTNGWDGAGNTAAIIAQDGHTNSAAKLCSDYENSDYGTGIFTDWYLPSIGELKKIWDNCFELNKVITNDNNDLTKHLFLTNYWSSTERNVGDVSLYDDTEQNAYYFSFGSGSMSAIGKNNGGCVRAVRAF